MFTPNTEFYKKQWLKPGASYRQFINIGCINVSFVLTR